MNKTTDSQKVKMMGGIVDDLLLDALNEAMANKQVEKISESILTISEEKPKIESKRSIKIKALTYDKKGDH